jgi:predicted nucleotidyltransferase
MEPPITFLMLAPPASPNPGVLRTDGFAFPKSDYYTSLERPCQRLILPMRFDLICFPSTNFPLPGPLKPAILLSLGSQDRAKMTENRTPRSEMITLQEQLREICDRHRIDLVYSFGSRAYEVRDFLSGLEELDNNTASDVDIGVKVSPARAVMSVKEKVKLTTELEDLLGVGRVDLVVLSEADPFLSANVVRGERIFCRDPYLADEYELYILRRAADLAPLEQERLSIIFTKAD